MVVNTEVSNLATKVIGATNPDRLTRPFNAGLTLIDGRGEPRPYLARELPELNGDTWRVFSDGRMLITWKLRPGLTWQDGSPLTAEDFVFAFQVYTASGLGLFHPKPQDRIERVVAVDPLTVAFEWRTPFLDQGEGLDPLPRHILRQPFEQLVVDSSGQRDAFLALRFWTMDYVGAGPYRLTNWEPASHLEGSAFGGHALGRPRIDRIVIRLVNDENTSLTTMLAGHAHLTMPQAIRFEHAMVLRREWGLDRGEDRGRLLFLSTSTTQAAIQFRVEYQKSPALLDVRVRKALSHATDRQTIVDALFEGQAPLAHTFAPPETSYYTDVDRAIVKYPYEPRQTDQLMAAAGLRKDRDGFFTSPEGERFQPSFWISAGAQREQMMAIVANTWQRAGIDVQPHVMPNALERDQEARSKFPGLLVHGISTGQSTSAESGVIEQIGTPANRWSGNNRAGWSHPEYERLWQAYNTTLDRTEQLGHYVQMMKLRSEEVTNIPLHYSLNVISHLSALRGPEFGTPGTWSHWNIHEWELR